MANKLMFDFISKKDFIFNTYLYNVIFNKELSLNETLLLIYFTNETEFNLNKISQTTLLTNTDILTSLSSLTTKNLLEMKVEEVDGKKREIIDLSLLYKEMLELNVVEKKKDVKEDIFELFESEFGRTLSPIEYEIINAWISSGMNQELIVGALKEATYNGVKSLRYIDKIIFEWEKKGFKSLKDVDNHLSKPSNEKIELFEYNWLEDES